MLAGNRPAARCVAEATSGEGAGGKTAQGCWKREETACEGGTCAGGAPLVARKCACTTSTKWKVYSLKSVMGWMAKATMDLVLLNVRI